MPVGMLCQGADGGRGDGVKSRPILFSGPMVRALLAGTKTQTRRIVKDAPEEAQLLRLNESGHLQSYVADVNGLLDNAEDAWFPVIGEHGCEVPVRCTYGRPGDRLWVKESWAYRLDHDHMNGGELYAAGVLQAWYWADGIEKCCNTGCAGAAGRVRAARFMPRWASRITLDITTVRVERLQNISRADAMAEGIADLSVADSTMFGIVGGDLFAQHPVRAYQLLWQSINGPGSWDLNPWLWVIGFKRVMA